MPARAKLPPGQGKRVPLNMRTTREVRDRLEEAAANSGRSLAQEVEFCVESALRGGTEEQAAFQIFGFDPKSYLAWRCLGDAISAIERASGKSWQEDWDTGQRVQEAFQIIVSAFGEQRPAEDRLSPKGRKRSEARKLRNSITAKEAVLLAMKAQMPGLKAANRLMADVMESDEDAAEGKAKE